MEGTGYQKDDGANWNGWIKISQPNECKNVDADAPAHADFLWKIYRQINEGTQRSRNPQVCQASRLHGRPAVDRRAEGTYL